jgi:glucose/arabinose dehydrogenase
MRFRRIAGGAALVLVLSGLTGVVGGPAPAGAADLPNVAFEVQPFATVSNPIAMSTRGSDPRLYVAERGGTVRIVNTNGTVVGTPVVSVSVNQTGERGLLGLTFSLDGTKLYVFYTITGGTIKVVEYTMSGDVGTAPRELFSIAHSASNHNGGEMHTGSDGMLYISIGDNANGDNAQDKTNLLGKILRVDPAPSESLPYTIPPDNPFVGDGGGVREEIWMYGLRNPWRWSFDKTTGAMWIADVGQNEYEEVNFEPAGIGGANWGWNEREGFHPYNGGTQPPGGRDPLFEHSHSGDGFCAIIGGFVYRGSAIPNLQGAYVYGDLCRNTLYAVEQSSGAVIDQIQFTTGISSPVTFGQDVNGELYVANLGGTISKIVSLASPTVSIGDEVTLEGDGRTRTMTFPVTLSRPSSTTVTVQYATASGTATGGIKPGATTDYKNRAGTITFTANNGKTPITKVISVPMYGDLNAAEGDESFTVSLSSPSAGLTLGRATGTGTILNDEADGVGGVSVGIGQGGIVEATSGNQKISVPVTKSNTAGGPVTVSYAITPGSATYSQSRTGGGDYGGKISGVLTFTETAIIKSIAVPIWPGAGTESDETFTITLSGLTGPATLTRTTATVTILQN